MLPLNKSSLSIVAIFFVTAVLGVGCVVGLFWGLSQRQQLNQVGQELRMSRERVESLKTDQNDLTEKLKRLQTERNSLEERVSALQAQFTLQGADVERFRQELQDSNKRVRQLQLERDEFQAQLSILRQEKDAAQQQVLHLAQLEQKNTDLDRAVIRLRERLNWLNRDYERLSQQLTQSGFQVPIHPGVINILGPSPGNLPVSAKQTSPSGLDHEGEIDTVELPPIVVRKDQAELAAPIRGRLLEVNASKQFVVIDKGQQDGVRLGMVFDVLHGAQRIGQVRVVRIRLGLSACDFIHTSPDAFFQVGDVALQKGF